MNEKILKSMLKFVFQRDMLYQGYLNLPADEGFLIIILGGGV